MPDIPQAAINAAMDAIERLGAGGSRTTVKIVLQAVEEAWPHDPPHQDIPEGWRERGAELQRGEL